MRYFIEFSYCGKNYFGYQIQPNEISVQEVLEKALSTILRSEIKTVGAGRTDTGVHAKKIFAHFDVDQVLSPKLKQQLNSFLPKDIAVHRIFRVKDDFHARFDATYRSYQYCIHTEKSPFLEDFSWYHRKDLDLQAMNDASKILFEYKDFESFSKVGSDNKTTICEIREAFWDKNGSQITFNISADRFLRNMVRSIVGTMVDVGTGKLSSQDLHSIITAKNRGKAGISAPAHGLFLVDVGYNYPELVP